MRQPEQHSRMSPSWAQLGLTGAQLGPIWNAAWEVTKGHLLGVSDYYVMYRHRVQSVL